MSNPTPSIRVNVDVTNPGQFFACCGLLELADRLWPGAEGWFEEREFCIAGGGGLKSLLLKATQIQIASDSSEFDDGDISDVSTDDDDDLFVPIEIISPISMRLDWWQEKGLKPWAGSMKAPAILVAMARAIEPEAIDPLNQEQVVLDTPKTVIGRNGIPRVVQGKPREPFCFDARRGSNSIDRDVGFVPDSLKKAYKIYSRSHPAVEFFSMIGLQRCRPRPTQRQRVFDYFTWRYPCAISLLPAAVCGFMDFSETYGYRFRNAFRTGQKKHKTFTQAIPIN